MKSLQGVTVFFWSANHIALQVTKTHITYDNGLFALEVNEDGIPIRVEKFRAFTHDSAYQENCSQGYIPKTIRDAINIWFDCKRKKEPAVISDFWDDCSQYIREDQVEMLKSLYELMILFQVFYDDEDIEEEHEQEQAAVSSAIILHLLELKSWSERRAEALIDAEKYHQLVPLTSLLRENKTAVEKKYIILSFLNSLRTEKGLEINLSDGLDDDSRFGKLPLKEWILPLGNSLNQQDDNQQYLDNLNLFGLHEHGINKGIDGFDNPHSVVNHNGNKTYYKFYSRYHNCSGYSRFLLEQGGITVFYTTAKLERYGVTDPEKYMDFMEQVSKKITNLNDKARDLMKRAQINPEPLETSHINFLADFKKGELNYESLPKYIRLLL